MVSFLKSLRHPLFITFAIIGLGFMFVTPPIQVSDELVHFYRAYQVGDAKILPVESNGRFGGYIDSGVVQYMQDRQLQAQESHYGLRDNVTPKGSFTREEVFAPFDNTVVYSPLLYLPGAAIVDLGRLFDFSISTTFYLVRFFNLVVCLLIIALGLYILKGRSHLALLLLLLPTSFFLFASASQDGLLVALAFLAVASLMALRIRPNNTKLWALLIVSLFLLTTGKLPYMPLLLLLTLPLFWVSKEKRLKYILIASTGFLVTLLYAVIWYLQVRGIPIQLIMVDRELAATINQSQQIHHIIHNPIQFIATMAQTNLTSDANRAIHEFFGMYGFYKTTPFLIPSIFILTWLTAVSVAVGIKLKGIRLNFKDNKLLLLIGALAVLASILLVQVILYLQWTSVGYYTIVGLQGRYYLPLAITAVGLLMLLCTPKEGLQLAHRTVIGASLILVIPSLILILVAYYTNYPLL